MSLMTIALNGFVL